MKDLFERVLDVPAPPMRSAESYAATARRAGRRRAMATASGAALAVVAVIAFSVAVSGRHSVRPVVVASASPTVSVSAVARPAMPKLHVIDAHREAITVALRGTVPAVLRAGTPEDRWAWAAELPGGRGYVSSVRVPVTGAGGSGWIELHYTFDAEDVGPVCGPAALAQAAAVLPGPPVSCSIADVGGERVEVIRATGAIAATRLLVGGSITVVATTGSLPAPPLTESELTAAVTDPALLP